MKIKKPKTEMQEEISRLVADFLHEQLGERAVSVKTFLHGNMLGVFVSNCLSPGELNLLEDEKHWKLLQELKAREFDKIKPLLMSTLFEKITGCEVTNLYSIIGQDGNRFVIITLSENLEKVDSWKL